MKFKIIDNCFFSREENNGTLSVIVGSTNQILYLNETARRALDKVGEWIDLDEFVDSLSIDDAPREKVRADFEELLYKLDAYDLARLSDLESDSETIARMAHKRDCQALSDFIKANMQSEHSCLVGDNPRFFARKGIYARMTQNKEYTVLDKAEGCIRAALILTWPEIAQGKTVLSLDSAVFLAGLSDDECVSSISRMLEALNLALNGACKKIRYYYMNPRQDWVKDALISLGFQKTAELAKETRSGRDVTYFDKFLP